MRCLCLISVYMVVVGMACGKVRSSSRTPESPTATTAKPTYNPLPSPSPSASPTTTDRSSVVPTLQLTSPQIQHEEQLIGQTITITFEMTGTDSASTSLYYRKDASADCSAGLDGWTTLATGLSPDTSSFAWNTTGLEEGEYFVCGRIQSETADVYGLAPGSVYLGNTIVVGQPSGIRHLRLETSFTLPHALHTDGTKLAVADSSANRVLLWNSIPTNRSVKADIVLGQVDHFNTLQNAGGRSASSLSVPQHVFFHGQRLILTDTFNNRVLIWNTMPSTHNHPADVVIGQSDFTSNDFLSPTSARTLYLPTFAGVFGGKLFIADSGNHRVLVWDSVPAESNAPADRVIGQATFSDFSANQGGSVSASSLNGPKSILVHEGRLFVVDEYNNRILVWDSLPSEPGAAADYVIGQPDFVTTYSNSDASSFSGPQMVATDGVRLYVTDSSNNRVLIWNSIPTATATPADLALGQPDLDSAYLNNGGLSASSMNGPTGLAVFGDKVLVAERYNHRVLIWTSKPNSFKVPADIVLDGAPLQTSLRRPRTSFTDGVKLFVADTDNHRVLIWNAIPTKSNTPADVVLGQSDLLHNGYNKGNYYPDADSMFYPTDVCSDGTHLVVADSSNNRVLIWNQVPSVNGAPAQVVLGQVDFDRSSSNSGGLSAGSLSSPSYVACVDDKLVVADTGNNRVLIWNSIPNSNKVEADYVLGQADFSSDSANRGGSVGANTLWRPAGVYSDGSYLFVADERNHRILVWNSFPNGNGLAAHRVLGQETMTTGESNNGGLSAKSLSNPSSAVFAGGRLKVADSNNNRILYWEGLPSEDGQQADHLFGQADFASTSSGKVEVSIETTLKPHIFSTESFELITDTSNDRVLIKRLQ